MTKKEALEDRLGPVLGRLGGPKSARNIEKQTLGFVKIHVFEKVRLREATWADLGSIWEAKRLQDGHRGGSKKELN